MDDPHPRKKPCPYCKSSELGTAFYDAGYGKRGHYAVVCNNVDCRAVGPLNLGESGAIERWNRRPIEEGLVNGLIVTQSATREFCQETDKAMDVMRRLVERIRAQEKCPLHVGFSISEAEMLEEAERVLSRE